MMEINNIVEDYNDGVDAEEIDNETDTYDEETGDLMVKIPRVFVPKRQVNIPLGDKCRIRIVENDDNIFFERKVVSKVECTDDSYRNDGYFSNILNIIEYVFSINFKEKLLNKKEIHSLEEMKEALVLTKEEMEIIARDVKRYIDNNEYISEVGKEALSR